MRRFFLAASLALVLHGFLMTVKVDWIKNKTALLLRPEPISLALTYKYPERIAAPAIVIPEPSRQIIPSPGIRPEKKRVGVEKAEKILAVPEKTVHKPVSPPVLKLEEDLPLEPLQEVVPERSQQLPPPSSSLEKTILPVYKENPVPEYPKIAEDRGYEGTVVLKVFVNRKGKVVDLKLSKSSGYSILDQAAMKSVKSWLFKPGKRGDEEVEMWIDVPVLFELK